MIFPEKRVKQFLLTNGDGNFAGEGGLSYSTVFLLRSSSGTIVICRRQATIRVHCGKTNGIKK